MLTGKGRMTVRPLRRVVLVAIVASILGLAVGIAIGRATAAPQGDQPARGVHAVKSWDRGDVGRNTPIPDGPTHTLRGGGNPTPVAIRRGTASYVAAGYGPRYLALPAGPGHRVRICGAGGCVTRTSTDAGPDLGMQRAGRIADLSLRDWEHVCGRPALYGLCEVAVSDPAP